MVPDIPLKLLLVSVQHSGTRFFVELIKEHLGFDPFKLKPNLVKGELEPKPFAAAHSLKNNMALVDRYIEKVNPVIFVTQRNRSDVEKSWRARGRPMKEMSGQFTVIDRFIKRYDPLVVSVDANDREEKLATFGKACGVTFQTDWRRVGSVYEGDVAGRRR